MTLPMSSSQMTPEQRREFVQFYTVCQSMMAIIEKADPIQRARICCMDEEPDVPLSERGFGT